MRLALIALTLLALGSPAWADAGAAPAPTALDIIALIREFGFPVFVAVWFMWRIENRLDRFTEQIEKLYTVVTVLTKIVDDKGGRS